MKTFNSLKEGAFKQILYVLFAAGFILGVLNSVGTNPAFAQQTPTPTMSFNPNCKAEVTYSWDVSSISGANRVLWELKKDSDFTNPNGRDPGREAYGSQGGTQGSETIDLRQYGQVLNGTKYYFRVVAKQDGQDLAPRSNSVKFDQNQSPHNSSPTGNLNATTSPNNPYRVTLAWNLPADIRNCSDRVYYEIKKGSNFTNPTGTEPGRIDQGSVNFPANSTTVNLQQHGAGDYYFRIVGKSGGTRASDDVGRRGDGVKVTLGAPRIPLGELEPVKPQFPERPGLGGVASQPSGTLPAPQNLTPCGTTVGQNFLVNFKWGRVNEADYYLHCISKQGVACPEQETDNQNTIVVKRVGKYSTSYTPPPRQPEQGQSSPLERFAGLTAHWTVAACNSADCNYQQQVCAITFPSIPMAVSRPTAPNLISPQDGALITERQLNAEWSNTGADTYKLCVSPQGVACDSQGSFVQQGIGATSYSMNIPMWLGPIGTELNWTVAACNTQGQCEYQQGFRSFTLYERQYYDVKATLTEVEVDDDCDNFAGGEWYVAVAIYDPSTQGGGTYQCGATWPHGQPKEVTSGTTLHPPPYGYEAQLQNYPSDKDIAVSVYAIECDGAGACFDIPMPCVRGCAGECWDNVGVIDKTIKTPQWTTGGVFNLGPIRTELDCGPNPYSAKIQVTATKK